MRWQKNTKDKACLTESKNVNVPWHSVVMRFEVKESFTWWNSTCGFCKWNSIFEAFSISNSRNCMLVASLPCYSMTVRLELPTVREWHVLRYTHSFHVDRIVPDCHCSDLSMSNQPFCAPIFGYLKFRVWCGINFISRVLWGAEDLATPERSREGNWTICEPINWMSPSKPTLSRDFLPIWWRERVSLSCFQNPTWSEDIRRIWEAKPMCMCLMRWEYLLVLASS